MAPDPDATAAVAALLGDMGLHVPQFQARPHMLTAYHDWASAEEMEKSGVPAALEATWGDLEYCPWAVVLPRMTSRPERCGPEVAVALRAHGVTRALLLGPDCRATLRAIPMLKLAVGGAPQPWVGRTRWTAEEYRRAGRVEVAPPAQMEVEASPEIELTLAALARGGWGLDFARAPQADEGPTPLLEPRRGSRGECRSCRAWADVRVAVGCAHYLHLTCAVGMAAGGVGGYACYPCVLAAETMH